MNFYRSQKLWRSVGLVPLLLAPIMAFAAEPPTPTKASTPLDEARQLLSIARLQKALDAPLDLKVENATVEEIAERVQKELLARKVQPAPRIEVRDVLPSRLSFDRKGSTAGAVLSSAAALAGAQLWFFGDRVLLAPMQSLSPEERKQTWSGAALTGSLWRPGFPPMEMMNLHTRRTAFSALVSDEIGTLLGKTGQDDARSAANGTTTPNTQGGQPPTWPPKVETVNMNQLSPDAQSALQEIVNDIKEQLRDSHRQMPMPPIDLSPFTLTGKSQVGLSSREGGTLVLNFPETDMSMSWTVDGTRITTGGGLPKTSPSAPRPPLPLDPSASKS